MNLSYKAKQLEQMFRQDMGNLLPVTVLNDKSIVYKKYRILKNKLGLFELRYYKTGDLISSFRTQSAALLAAKFYDKDNFARYNEVVSLDTKYYVNLTDSEIFKHRIKTTKDIDRKDLFQWRFEITEQRAKSYKAEITRLFKTHF